MLSIGTELLSYLKFSCNNANIFKTITAENHHLTRNVFLLTQI